MRHDSDLIVRSDLIRRIDAIIDAQGREGAAALCERVDAVRRLACIHALDTVERLASLLESALAYHGHGRIVSAYLEMIRDAVGSEDQGPEVYAAYAAALSLRVGY
jgi:hypothetical protein